MKRNFFTPEEDGLILQHYETLGAKGMLEILPSRSRESIKSRAQVLGLSRRRIAMGRGAAAELLDKANAAANVAAGDWRYAVEPGALRWRVAA